MKAAREARQRFAARVFATAAAVLIGHGEPAVGLQQAPGIRQELYPVPFAPEIPEDTELVTLDSGLKYSVLQAGLAPEAGGRTPLAGDCVTVHFSAWREDGRLYDSSVLRYDPLKTWVGSSIAGWNEALARMTKGARWKISLPAKLCTGALSAQPEVPPDTAMIFELELLDILFSPTFHPARPAVALTTPGGLRYEILKEGTEPAVVDKERILIVDYGLWTREGTLLDSSARQGAMFEIKPSQFDSYWDLKFMKEAFGLLRPGSRLRFEVPPEQCYGSTELPGLPPNSHTVWEFELVKVRSPRALPEFVLPDPKECSRTDVGLLYQVVREGSGRKPSPQGKVVANYALWLVNGKVFDASYERGEPVRLDLADPGMLPGLKEALLLMSEGGILRCRVRPELAYGGRGWSTYIGPNAELVLYLELVSVG